MIFCITFIASFTTKRTKISDNNIEFPIAKVKMWVYNNFQLESSRFPPPLYERGLSSKTPLLSFDQATIGYGKQPISTLSWDINKQDVWIVLGPNGAGKSTLSNVLLNEADLLQGEIRMRGQSIQHLSLLERVENVGIALQQTRPDLPFTVEEILAQSQGETAIDVADIVSRFDLDAVKNQPITQLSGGQWQRVVLASIAVQNSPVWWLDEPFTWMDPGQHDRLVKLLYTEWSRHHRTLVIVAHDLTPFYGSALYDQAKVLMIKDGHVYYQGSLSEGLQHMEAVFDRSFERIAWNGRTVVV